MLDSWIQSFFDELVKNQGQRGPLHALGSSIPYMLFSRKAGSFQMIQKNGYSDPDFSYPFLVEKPELLSPLLSEGVASLPASEANKTEHILWATIDQVNNPHFLLIAEIPIKQSELNGHFLRLVLSFEVAFRQKAVHYDDTIIDMPIWLESILVQFLEKKSPVLVVAEAGSGKEELVQAFLKNRYGSVSSSVFFHPGRLTQAVQLRELFGDAAGARLGGISPNIPIIAREEPVIVIQETGDLDRLAQLRLLALFSTSGRKKLWIFETCRDLDTMSRSDRFLPALYELLCENMIILPPLRNCIDDLFEEVDRLMDSFRKHYKRNIELSSSARSSLSAYHWPGNWRELRNTLESAFLMARDNLIDEKDLRLGRWAVPEDWDDLNLRKHSEITEKMLLLRAYSLHGGNQVHMARALGISRGSLQYKLVKYKLN